MLSECSLSLAAWGKTCCRVMCRRVQGLLHVLMLPCLPLRCFCAILPGFGLWLASNMQAGQPAFCAERSRLQAAAAADEAS